MQRVVKPEILDELDPDDPRAIRSRRDLRWINAVLGNERWIMNEVGQAGAKTVVEIGAGEGKLANRLSKVSEVTAYDLAPRPGDLAGDVRWKQGDIFDSLGEMKGDALVASLFLHHFEAGDLARLAEAALGFQTLIFAEPWRIKWGHIFGSVWWPFMNDVTWHDMHVSIDAGFAHGELQQIFGNSWTWREERSHKGSIRVVGRREE